jgi:hypothetical protein
VEQKSKLNPNYASEKKNQSRIQCIKSREKTDKSKEINICFLENIKVE